MWKETIICIVLVIAIIIGNYMTQNYTKKSVKELSNKLNVLKEDILNVEEHKITIEQAKKTMEEVKKEWEVRHDKLAYYIEHDELEKVETDLTSLNSFLEAEEYAEAISELDKGVFVLKHIEDKYAFNLENVF